MNEDVFGIDTEEAKAKYPNLSPKFIDAFNVFTKLLTLLYHLLDMATAD